MMDLCIPMTHRLVKKEGFKLLLQSEEEDIAPGTGERSFFFVMGMGVQKK